MNAHDITSAFPHPSLTPSTLRPNYATLAVLQKELSGNVASVSSHLGDGRQGHLALTISEAKYLAITGNVAFVPPLNPPLQTEQAVGATGPQITEANRMHLENIQHLPSRRSCVTQPYSSRRSARICQLSQPRHHRVWKCVSTDNHDLTLGTVWHNHAGSRPPD